MQCTIQPAGVPFRPLSRAKEADLALQSTQLHLESNPEDAVVRGSLGDLRKKAVFLAEAERHFYYQKAKIHFLKIGDRNTKFFHDMVKRNAAKSSILAITKSDGSTITSAADIRQEFVAYFTSLLGTEAHTLPVDNDVFEWGPKPLRSMHQSFAKWSHRWRLSKPSFRFVIARRPGQTVFQHAFFKKTWSVVGDEVCLAVTDFFRSGRLLRHQIVSLPSCPNLSTPPRLQTIGLSLAAT
ncbi:UNVERIFIED_CONTAM: hypothetical protein Slati_4203500 [Sesamum latifolium]|uniref:Uncharacterized protein n=1 Tax=Sesamum latifolium TaxID=2727402 RepID=A0AAW2T9Z7_9LAMI